MEKSTCRFKIYLFKRNDILPLQQGKTGCVKKTQFGGISEGNDKVLMKILNIRSFSKQRTEFIAGLSSASLSSKLASDLRLDDN